MSVVKQYPKIPFTCRLLLVFILTFVLVQTLSAQFAGGSGTDNDPWQIATAAHLNNVRNYLGELHQDKHFIQTADIDLGVAPWNQGRGWGPIGHRFLGKFQGTYDGGFHVINNLTIDEPIFGFAIGLFGDTENATIRRVCIEDAKIASGFEAGILIGTADNISVIDCCVNGDISGTIMIGGIVGLSNNNSSIVRSNSSGSVELFTEDSEYGGGITGGLQNSAISDSYSSMSVRGGTLVGGLVGLNWFSNITNSYASGPVTAFNDNPAMGGLVGGFNGGAISGSFWNTVLTGQNTSPGGGSALTIEQMIVRNTFTASNWNFDELWDITDGVSFPYFSRQETHRGKNLPGPYNLRANVNHETQSVTLNWNMFGVPDYYNIYRDNVIVDTVNHPVTHYLDEDMPQLEYQKYHVTAVFVEDEDELETPYSNWEIVRIEVDFSAGNGTEDDPYHVDSPGSLALIREHLDAHFIQTADIDLGVMPWNEGEGWIPIAQNHGINFEGSYDGNGYNISALTINRPGYQFQALFGSTENATLRNIGLLDININGSRNVAGIVGRVIGGTSIEKSFVTGIINASGLAGGIVGDFGANDPNSSITDCYTIVTINALVNTAVGGIAGQFNNGTIARNYAAGPIYIDAYTERVGGIIGRRIGQSGNLTRNYWNLETTLTDTGGNGIGAGSTNDEFTMANNFNGFDFNNVWRIDQGESYPYLRWEGEEAGTHNIPFLLPPVNIVCNAGTDYALLSWDEPNDGANISGYNIYRNGFMVNVEPLINREFRDDNLQEFTEYTYQVSAVYESGESILSRRQNVYTSSFAGGSGSEEDPFLVETALQLNGIRLVGEGHFRQTADIDLGVEPWNQGEGWQPINLTEGSYDGNGFLIENMTIHSQTISCAGLFGIVGRHGAEDPVVLKRIGVENVDIRTGYSSGTGAIAGSVQNNAEISLSYATGKIKASGSVGGLVGDAGLSRDLTIENCYSSVNILVEYMHYSSNEVGGLAGNMTTGRITNSYVNGYLEEIETFGFTNPVGGGQALNSYWNIETTGIEAGLNGEGRSALQMMQRDTYEDWNFDEVWAIGYEGEVTYPYLRWQQEPSQYNNPIVQPVIASYTDRSSEAVIFWSAPSTGDPDRYNLYRNGDFVTFLEADQREYREVGLDDHAQYVYNVTTIVDERESFPSNKSFITPLEFPFSGGRGTVAEPYQVRFPEQLNNIRHNDRVHYLQTQDINLINITNWQPIIGRSGYGAFTGSFDGNGKTIENLSINESVLRYVGLFGSVSGERGGFLRNIILKNINISNPSRASGIGGLVGFISNVLVYNCHVSGTLVNTEGSRTSRIGGLAGLSAAEIRNSSSSVNINGLSNAGSLVGFNTGRIYNSYTSGSVSGINQVGGLVGSNYGTITNCFSIGEVTATGFGGGLVGSGFDEVINSYWDTETSLQESSVGGSGKTTEQMTYPYDEDVYVNWDFDDIWTEDITGEIHDGYPYLLSRFGVKNYPAAAIYPTPRHEEADVLLDIERLSWQYHSTPLHVDPVGFRVYLNTTNAFDEDQFTWVDYDEEKIDFHCYDILPENLDPDCIYYWKVVPTTNEPNRSSESRTRNRRDREKSQPSSQELDTSPARADAHNPPVWVFKTGQLTDVEDLEVKPLVTTLNRNYPNPFNPETTIEFTLAESGTVEIDIFNIRGQLVRKLLDEPIDKGKHQIIWDGRDHSKRRVSSGIYFYRMKAGDYTSANKMIMMK